MHRFDGVGPGEHEDVVAARVAFAAEIVCTELHGLQAGAHGAVVDQNAFCESVQIAAVGVATLVQDRCSLFG